MAELLDTPECDPVVTDGAVTLALITSVIFVLTISPFPMDVCVQVMTYVPGEALLGMLERLHVTPPGVSGVVAPFDITKFPALIWVPLIPLE